MKLTLSVGGGFTGLFKEHSIDVTSLNEATSKALLAYINEVDQKKPTNFNESWTLDEEKEVPIVEDKMSDELKDLYGKMKKKLRYPGK